MFTAHYHDTPEHGGFSAEYQTETPNCKPYYSLRIGTDLTVFLAPDRMKMLEDVLAEARREREVAAIKADQAEFQGVA